MEIKVLGTGCSKCKALFETVKEVVAEMNIDAKVEKVEDMMEIMNYDVMMLPAMVLDGKVVAKGVIKYTEVKQILEGACDSREEDNNGCIGNCGACGNCCQ